MVNNSSSPEPSKQSSPSRAFALYKPIGEKKAHFYGTVDPGVNVIIEFLGEAGESHDTGYRGTLLRQVAEQWSPTRTGHQETRNVSLMATI